MAAIDDDERRVVINEFLNVGGDFPVEFDKLWPLCYDNKDAAVKDVTLKFGSEGVNYIIQPIDAPDENLINVYDNCDVLIATVKIGNPSPDNKIAGQGVVGRLVCYIQLKELKAEVAFTDPNENFSPDEAKKFPIGVRCEVSGARFKKLVRLRPYDRNTTSKITLNKSQFYTNKIYFSLDFINSLYIPHGVRNEFLYCERKRITENSVQPTYERYKTNVDRIVAAECYNGEVWDEYRFEFDKMWRWIGLKNEAAGMKLVNTYFTKYKDYMKRHKQIWFKSAMVFFMVAPTTKGDLIRRSLVLDEDTISEIIDV